MGVAMAEHDSDTYDAGNGCGCLLVLLGLCAVIVTCTMSVNYIDDKKLERRLQQQQYEQQNNP